MPVDSLLYRFYELTQVYGTTIKALIHEEFGEGIMSAVDFELSIDRIEDPRYVQAFDEVLHLVGRRL